jgi:hypothetical protein
MIWYGFAGIPGRKKHAERTVVMANKRKITTIAGAVAALGVSAAFLWLRDFTHFVRSGGFEKQQEEYARRRMTQVRMNNAQPIPASGAIAPAPPAPAGAATSPGSGLNEQTALLVQYLVSFNSMVELLRSRSQEKVSGRQGFSLTEKDRDSYHQTLDRLEEQYAIYRLGNLRLEGTAARVHTLTDKIRETMRRLDLTDDDLFRTYGEVRTQACQVMGEVRDAGVEAGTDFTYARSLYECE